MSKLHSIEVASMAHLQQLHTQFASLPYTFDAQNTKPEYLYLPSPFLINLSPDELDAALRMLFDVALSGFACDALKHFNTATGESRNRKWNISDFWEFIAERGFIDHTSGPMSVWYKPRCLVAEPPAINFNYTKSPDITTWDTNSVYSHALGTSPQHMHDYLVDTEWFRKNDITHIVEPMAACGELCYFGHFSYPDLTYSMLDLDQSALEKTVALPWLPQTKMEYHYGDVLEQASWDKLQFIKPEQRKGKSVCFIGKQSQNIFSPKQLVKFLDMCLTNCDFVIIESMEYTHEIITNPSWDSTGNTSPHLEHRGIIVSLEVTKGGKQNRLAFESNLQVVVKDANTRVQFIDYSTWHCYTPSEIMHLAEAVLDVPREGMGFLDDIDSDYMPIDEYTNQAKTRGYLNRKVYGNVVGSVQTLLLTRGKV